jgi:hypothetical protein
LSETTLDGAKAMLISGGASKDLEHPEIMIISRYQGFQYMISGGTEGKRSTKAAVEAIRKSWKWIEFEPPSRRVELGSPVSALKGSITIQLPHLMRMYPPRREGDLDLAMDNLKRQELDFLAYVAELPKQRGEGVKDIAILFLERVIARAKVQTKAEWKQLEGPTPRYITGPFEAEIPDTKGKTTVMWAIIEVDEERLALITFTLAAATSKENEIYAKVAEKIVMSVKPTGK